MAALRRHAGHRNPSVRGTALAALAVYPDPAARAAIVAGLRDRAGMVRAAAARGRPRARARRGRHAAAAARARREPAARALAALADAELARRIGEHLGKVPDAVLALCLGQILLRADFGPDPARVEVVRAVGKIQDPAAIAALAEYLDATPKQPARVSRQEAELIVNARLGGDR